MNQKEFNTFSSITVAATLFLTSLFIYFSEGNFNWAIFLKLGAAVTITGIIHQLILYLWKQNFPWFKFFTPKPYLAGAWYGGIKRKNDTAAYPFILIIDQTFFSVKCRTISAYNNKSESYGSHLSFTDDEIKLIYSWEGGAQEKGGLKFKGVTELLYDRTSHTLHGDYFSQHMSGKLYFEFHSGTKDTQFNASDFSDEYIKTINQNFNYDTYD